MSTRQERAAALAAEMPGLMRTARALVRDKAQAEDLLQEVLLALWQVMEQGQAIENIGAYARTALRNRARKRQSPVIALDDAEPIDAGLAPPDVVVMLDEVRRAIDGLPADQRRLMRLVQAGETSPAQLAKLTGVPVGTVMSRLARARRRLRTLMDLPTGQDLGGLFDSAA